MERQERHKALVWLCLCFRNGSYSYKSVLFFKTTRREMSVLIQCVQTPGTSGMGQGAQGFEEVPQGNRDVRDDGEPRSYPSEETPLLRCQVAKKAPCYHVVGFSKRSWKPRF